VDQMVLRTQQWLNRTYRGRTGFGSVVEDGQTGWGTVNALIRALQIELGITATANNFGPGTQEKFRKRWPNGIRQQTKSATHTSNVYGIIQGALWCKGYSTGAEDITKHFYAGTGAAIKELKLDMGFGGDSTVDLGIMRALLSMQQFKLLKDYGGQLAVRVVQQEINREYRDYTGIIPADGVYGREMNTALIEILQAIEGFSPDEATGTFGSGTRGRLMTIDKANAASHPKWVWMGSVALICNGYGVAIAKGWSIGLSDYIRQFQEKYALPQTGTLTPTTWMSLLTSKGDPDRPCEACDTRFEITDARVATLKADGYRIVGRYLTEPGQDELDPSAYFKAIRPGELARIVEGGLRYFPIFQEYSTDPSHFNAATGADHARKAREAAQRLGIPPTHIYFAVDYDATDPEVDAYILPYFQAIRGSLGGGYKVGIYASRNICTRIISAGFAGTAFVSDMSTGFSGNLGYPIPEKWTYDQFAEISDYKGQGWDLDRVAYSGAFTPPDFVGSPSLLPSTPSESDDYASMSPIELVSRLETRFDELREEKGVGVDWLPIAGTNTSRRVVVPTYSCILNYLAKPYLNGGGSGTKLLWSLVAGMFRDLDARILEDDAVAGKIISALDRYIAPWRQSMKDPLGEDVDLAHLSATTLGYIMRWLGSADWTGWAGDLASAMQQIQKVMDWNPNAEVQLVASALVGQGDDYRSHPALKGLKLDKQRNDGIWDSVTNTCNRDDLCCDGDAIAIFSRLKIGQKDDTHLLSRTLRQYYENRNELSVRFRRIATSVGAVDRQSAEERFEEITDSLFRDILNETSDYADVKTDVTLPACRALADFVF